MGQLDTLMKRSLKTRLGKKPDCFNHNTSTSKVELNEEFKRTNFDPKNFLKKKRVLLYK